MTCLLLDHCTTAKTSTMLFMALGLCWGCTTTIGAAVTITGFTLVDTSTSANLGTLRDGGVINLSQEGHQLSLVAQVSSSTDDDALSPWFQFIRFSLDDGCVAQQESVPPYSLGGSRDIGAGFGAGAGSDRSFAIFNSVPTLAVPGRHTVTAAAVDRLHNVVAVQNVTFTVIDAGNVMESDNANLKSLETNVADTMDLGKVITGLTLMNADTNLPLVILRNGTEIDLAVTGTTLSIGAEIGIAASAATLVAQVLFNYNNASNYVDRNAPYTLGYEIMHDDNSTDIIPYVPLSNTGQHTVTATALDGAGQDVGAFQVVYIVSDSRPSPKPITTSLFIDARMDQSILPPQVTLSGVTSLYESGLTSIRDTAPYSPGVFNAHRYGRIFGYQVSGLEADSPYQITMGWAEKTASRCVPGKRIFQVVVNGQVFEDELDVFQRVGTCDTAWMETRVVTTDGTGGLTIEFFPIVRNPMVSFIHIQHVLRDDAPPTDRVQTTPAPSVLSTEPMQETTAPSGGSTFHPSKRTTSHCMIQVISLHSQLTSPFLMQ